AERRPRTPAPLSVSVSPSRRPPGTVRRPNDAKGTPGRARRTGDPRRHSPPGVACISGAARQRARVRVLPRSLGAPSAPARRRPPPVGRPAGTPGGASACRGLAVEDRLLHLADRLRDLDLARAGDRAVVDRAAAPDTRLAVQDVETLLCRT